MAVGNRVGLPAGAQGIEDFAIVIDPDDVGQPILRPVLDYWERKRGARPMPPRRDVEPAELKAYLRHLFLIEPLPGAEFRYRLVGSEITERYGRNNTGKTVREIYGNLPAVAEWFTGLLLTVTTRQRPVLATGTLRAIGKEHVFSEALLLPLSDDGSTVTMIFGATRYSPATPAVGTPAPAP